MPLYEIQHRWTGSVLFSLDIGSLKLAVEAAVSSGANLREANLRGANLRGANLREANLRGADLREADLREANLSKANLSQADLRGANLREANLRWADLREADLREANLSKADLSQADLRGANLRGANLQVPVIDHLDTKILAAIDAGGTLDMGAWHQCQTIHCRAGWAIHLAGQAGYALEDRVGSCAAGALIYQASAGYVPNFYAQTDTAYADIQAHATTETVSDEAPTP